MGALELGFKLCELAGIIFGRDGCTQIHVQIALRFVGVFEHVGRLFFVCFSQILCDFIERFDTFFLGFDACGKRFVLLDEIFVLLREGVVVLENVVDFLLLLLVLFGRVGQFPVEFFELARQLLALFFGLLQFFFDGFKANRETFDFGGGLIEFPGGVFGLVFGFVELLLQGRHGGVVGVVRRINRSERSSVDFGCFACYLAQLLAAAVLFGPIKEFAGGIVFAHVEVKL